MGKRTDYDLSGWGPNGRFLSAFEKEEIQDLLFDEGVDDYGCSHSANEPEMGDYSDDVYGDPYERKLPREEFMRYFQSVWGDEDDAVVIRPKARKDY